MIDIAAETAFPAVVVSCLKKIYHIILALDNESAYEVMTHLVSVERCRFMRYLFVLYSSFAEELPSLFSTTFIYRRLKS